MCHPCYLCPQCNVIDKRGNACCFSCLDRGDRDHVVANYPDKMFRIRLLGAQMLDEQEEEVDWPGEAHEEQEGQPELTEERARLRELWGG